MIVPTPRTWNNKDRPNYAVFNKELRDNIEFLLNPPMCKLRKEGVQSFVDSTWTAIVWDYDEVDTDNMHSLIANSNRITPKTQGWYIGSTGMTWKQLNTANDTSGRRLVAVQKNAGSYIVRMDSRASGVQNRDRHNKAIPFAVSMNGTTDYIEVLAYQDSGSTMTTQGNTFGKEFWPEFYMRWYRGL